MLEAKQKGQKQCGGTSLFSGATLVAADEPKPTCLGLAGRGRRLAFFVFGPELSALVGLVYKHMDIHIYGHCPVSIYLRHSFELREVSVLSRHDVRERHRLEMEAKWTRWNELAERWRWASISGEEPLADAEGCGIAADVLPMVNVPFARRLLASSGMLSLRLYEDDCRLTGMGNPEDIDACLTKVTSLWVQGLSDEGSVINMRKSVTLGLFTRVSVQVAPQNFGKFGSWLCVWDLPMGDISCGFALRVVSHSSLPAVGLGRGWASTLRRRHVLAVGGPPPLVRRPLVLAVGGFPPFVTGRGSRAWVGPHLPSPAVGPRAWVRFLLQLPAVGPAAPCRRRTWVLSPGVAGRGSPLLPAVAGRGSRCFLPSPAVGPAASCRRRPWVPLLPAVVGRACSFVTLGAVFSVYISRRHSLYAQESGKLSEGGAVGSCAQLRWRTGGHEVRAEVISGWACLTCPRPLQESPASFGVHSTVSSVGPSLVLFPLCFVLCWCCSSLISMLWRG